TTTTTAFSSCNNLRWNQTGQIVAGTTQGTSANQLKNPSCLYIDNNNTLYICDHDNNRVQKWIQGAITGVTVAGSSTGTSGSTSTLLSFPIDLTFDDNGFMYVVDYNNNRVQRFAPNSTNGTTVAGVAGSHSNALTNLKKPTAIDIDNNSNIYILDMGNTRLVEWAQNATSGTLLISDNSLSNDYDILLVPNSSNEIYISDQGGHAIYLWTFGALSPSMTLQTVNDSHNTLNNQMGMVLDPYGNLYVADTGNNRVVMYCANSTVGVVVAEDNNSVPSLKKPVALAFDSDLNFNFYPAPIQLDGYTWPTVEHYFQAQKFVSNEMHFKNILGLATPREAFDYVRTYKSLRRSDWENVKDDIMFKACLAKFQQHPKLKELLLSTGDRTLIEHTKNDSYWGDGGDGTGRNQLGITLMKVRDYLNNHH
ncbi:unnamed protein product, partial [Adineta steineri]